MRALLDTRGAAKKLNRSARWFRENRAELYAAGFPRPVLGDAQGGHAAYDPAAIDRWLDARMPAALRDSPQEIARVTDNWEHKLQQRLQVNA